MKRFTLFFLLALTGILFINYSDGPPSKTAGAEGDGGTTCKQSGCHSDAAQQNVAKSWLTTDIPSKGFVLGATYNVTITTPALPHTVFGFSTTVQDKKGNQVGTMSLSNTSQTQFADANKTYLTQSLSGSRGTTPKSWQFTWKAPASGDSATFYACVMLANGNGNERGDSLFLSKVTAYRAFNTDVTEIKSQVTVKVAPNPASISAQSALFNFNKLETGIWQLNLYTLYGALICSEKIETTGDIALQMPLKHLISGIYAYSIIGVDGSVKSSGKLILGD